MLRVSRNAGVVATGVLLGLSYVLGPRVASAQTVHGRAIDASGRPASGVIATLVDTAGTALARTLTNASGQFVLAASTAGRFRIRALRIGYRPTITELFQLAIGADVERQLVMNALPVGLDTIHVVDRSVCRQRAADSTATVFLAWEQVRAALTAAQLTVSDRDVIATTIVYERTLDRDATRILKQATRLRTERVREPWRELAPDSLRRLGYVTLGRDDSTTFYAPGLDMLLSAAFVEDHCFRLARGSDTTRLGVEFEPIPARRRVAEVSGTLWIDRASAEVRRLEFRYVNVPPEHVEHADGELEFVHMVNGGWVIARWNIRMPVIGRAPVDAASETGMSKTWVRPTVDPQVTAIHAVGGTLTTVVAGTDTVWSRAPVTWGGVVVDSLSHDVVPKSRVALSGTNLQAVTDERGRFAIASVLPGAYSVEVRTPALDSLNAVHMLAMAVEDSAVNVEIRVPSPRQVESALCGTKRLSEPGIVTGSIQMPIGDSLPTDTRVIATWMVAHLKLGGAAGPVEIRERRSLETPVMANNAFRFCGVPVNTELTIVATGANAESPEPEIVRIPQSMRFARTDVGLARLVAGNAVFSGTVLVDSTTQPIPAAAVALPDLGLATQANELGAFRLAEIPPGQQHVVVRRIGFSPLDTVLSFGSGQRVERQVRLTRTTILDSVRVLANAMPRSMLTFEEHRRLGLGHFLTRAELAKTEGQTTGAVMRSLSGVRLVSGRSTQEWVVSARNRGTQRTVDIADRLAGARRDCYAAVYLNNAVVYRGRPQEPLFDINSVRPDQLEAVEYYAGAAETPLEYGTLDSTCGVLVLWTRRTP
jgi:hypothetical protein